MENDDNDDKVFYETTTATGRKIGVVNSESHGLFKVALVDGKGGDLPDNLKGRFTGVRFAQEAIDAFVARTFSEVEARTRKTKKPDEAIAVNG
jgi:hypothetical protein